MRLFSRGTSPSAICSLPRMMVTPVCCPPWYDGNSLSPTGCLSSFSLVDSSLDLPGLGHSSSNSTPPAQSPAPSSFTEEKSSSSASDSPAPSRLEVDCSGLPCSRVDGAEPFWSDVGSGGWCWTDSWLVRAWLRGR